MSIKKPLKLVSTDSVGWLGTPKQFLYLYQEYFANKTFDGVEMIAFKPITRLKKFIEILKEKNISTLSFHGKTGGENRLPEKYGIVIKIVNLFICDEVSLLKNFPQTDFLSHTPYLKNSQVENNLIRLKPKTLWIENHIYGDRGVEETKDLIINYRKKGINAKGMLDLYHLLAKLPIGKIKKDWIKIIKKIKNYLPWFSGIHLPIGTRKNDSLEIEEITDEMLDIFAKEIVPYLDRIVIENQQAGIGLFGSNWSMLKKQKQRNQINFLRLKKIGIL